MNLRELTLPQLRQAYQTDLTEAFPPEELKPLAGMERMWEQGAYLPLALYDGRDRLGLAFCWKDLGDRRYVLLDYLAVPAAARNRGAGAKLLAALRAYFPEDTVILGEAEALGGGEEDALRRRRLDFYARNGARLAAYDTALFGVRFRTLYWAAGEVDEDELIARHQAIYRQSLRPSVYERYIQIPLRAGEAVRPVTAWEED